MPPFTHCSVDSLAPAKGSAYATEGIFGGGTDKSLFAVSKFSLNVEEHIITERPSNIRAWLHKLFP